MNRKGEFDGDDLHFVDGSHRDSPPKGTNPLTWERKMRLHKEGHGTDALARKIAPDLFPPSAPRRIG